MKEDRVAHLLVLTLILTGLPVSLALVSERSLMAQQPGPRRTDRRENPGERSRRERQERQLAEMELRSIEKLGKTPPNEKPPERLLYEQIGEDFRLMQEVNNQMMRTVFQSQPSSDSIDLDQVMKALTEINKRASRLKSNLRLPGGDEKKIEAIGHISNSAQLKSSLQTLDGLIMSFIDNPTFERPGVVDVEQSAKAKRDLEGIVEHSKSIREKAKKLGKGT